MKRGTTREDIIRTTQALITRNGIRAVRVDEIAQTLGISKRTLYETFEDKTALVNSCLDDLSGRQRRKVGGYMKRRTSNPIQKIRWLMNLYVDNLQRTDYNFLTDLEHQVVYTAHFERDKCFWKQAFSGGLDEGVAAGYILPDTECDKIAQYLLGSIYKLRLANAPDREQILFCQTILRGIATRKGIDWIDARR